MAARKKKSARKPESQPEPMVTEREARRRERAAFLSARHDAVNGCKRMASEGSCGYCEAEARARFPDSPVRVNRSHSGGSSSSQPGEPAP